MRFDPDEDSAERAYAGVKICRCTLLQIRKETCDPWRKVMIEDFTVHSCRRWNDPAGKTCHDLENNRGMIFRLRLSHYSLDADPLQRLAQVREWATMQKTR